MSLAKLSKSGPFSRVRKNIELIEHKHAVHHFKARDLEITNK